MIISSLKNLIFILLLFISATVFSKEKKSVAVYDTIKISSIKKVSPQIEKEIFSDKDFVYHKDAKATKSWWDAFMDLMRKLFEWLFGKTVAKHPETSYSIVKYIVCAFFVVAVIFLLWKSKFRSVLKGDSKIAANPFADLPENIEGINIDTHIENAMKVGNYRLAIRWCFLKSLQWLNKQNKITWQTAKTNIDYQHELKDENLKEDFISLSSVFEYVWYGETIPTENSCIDYKNKVEKFISNPNV